jgi:hypothetical protein
MRKFFGAKSPLSPAGALRRVEKKLLALLCGSAMTLSTWRQISDHFSATP